MKLLTSLAGGLAGAITVTILHEIIRKVDHSAPRLDKLGKQATTRLFQAVGEKAPTGQKLYNVTLAGELISNTLYYSLVGARVNKALSAGSILGVGAGLGALEIPKFLNLDKDNAGGNSQRRWMTVGLYLTGGIVAAGVMKWLNNRKKKNPRTFSTTTPPVQSYKPVLDITV